MLARLRFKHTIASGQGSESQDDRRGLGVPAARLLIRSEEGLWHKFRASQGATDGAEKSVVAHPLK
jgi:hypothetical protein